MGDGGSSSTQATVLAARTDARTGRARPAADDTKQQAAEVARQAKEQTGVLLDRARRDLAEQTELRRAQAARSLRSLAGQFGALARGDVQGAGSLPDYAAGVRDWFRLLAARLDERPDAMLADLRDFARRRPLMFLGTAGAAGLFAGGLLRAHRAEDSPTVGSTPELIRVPPQECANGPLSLDPPASALDASSVADAPLTPVGPAGDVLDVPARRLADPALSA